MYKILSLLENYIIFKYVLLYLIENKKYILISINYVYLYGKNDFVKILLLKN